MGDPQKTRQVFAPGSSFNSTNCRSGKVLGPWEVCEIVLFPFLFFKDLPNHTSVMFTGKQY